MEGDSVVVIDEPLEGCKSLIRKVNKHKDWFGFKIKMFGDENY